jgi:hypothetical protein
MKGENALLANERWETILGELRKSSGYWLRDEKILLVGER